MTLTAEELREIRRANGRKSRGPTSESGKMRSRANAVDHGMRSKVLAMPGESDEETAGRGDAWYEFYRPGSPAARHMLNECVRATVLSDRCQAAHDTELDDQIRKDLRLWERAR